MTKRRLALGLLASLGWPHVFGQQSQPDLAGLLQAGACVLMLRHAETETGIGDPAHFTLGQCQTQRNLSASGREQSRRLGQWFARQQLLPRRVQSSAWCRCRDTAQLAFGRHTLLSALDSTFQQSARQPAQTDALRPLLKAVPAGQFDVWVTHQVNISSLTGESASMGEAFVLDASGTVLARTLFS